MPGEDDELVNEGMDGKACAQYLQSNLSSRGYSVPLFVCEDWEWWVEVQGLDFTCGLGVYGMQIDDSDDLDICVTVLSSLRFDTRLARRSRDPTATLRIAAPGKPADPLAFRQGPRG